MTTNEYKHIASLLERFFEGATSKAEEESLYRFFSQREDIPAEWMPYRPVFDYFHEGISRECAPVRKTFLSRRKRRLIWTAAAVALVLLATVGRLYLRRETPFDPYEGSYIIQNGVRITDMEIIRPELEAVTERVMEEKEEMEQLLASADEAVRESMQMQEEINRILHQTE
ncbi:MAG: hypothetical protein LBB84_08275 [Tannerellaceae bacterium]|jgi:hypothetical protein|nr:hypothetical protein [Tannerellaceae bacterium]